MSIVDDVYNEIIRKSQGEKIRMLEKKVEKLEKEVREMKGEEKDKKERDESWGSMR
jgi:hypothetical protein